MKEQDEWMTIAEAVAALGLSEHIIRRLIKEGKVAERPNPLDRRTKLVNVTQLRAIQEAS